MKKISLILGVLCILSIPIGGCGGRMAPSLPPEEMAPPEEVAPSVEVQPLSLEYRVEATMRQCEAYASRYECDLLQADWSERPDFGFPNQVLSPDELEVGEVYVRCSLIADLASPYELLGVHSDPELGNLKVEMQRWDRESREYVFNLSEMGVVPYFKGEWDPCAVLLHLLPYGIED